MRSRLRKIIHICFLLVIAVSLSSGSFVFAEKGPSIKFKNEKWNFGKVKQGKIVNHVFIFKNEGDKTLNIGKVNTSCGCTAVLVSEKKIPPGKEGKIKVTLNTSGYGGKLTKYIYVRSNDPAHPRKRLTVSVETEIPPQPKIELDRYFMDLGLLMEGDEIRAKTKIRNRGELELRVHCTHRDAVFFNGGKKVTFPIKIASGKEADIEIKIPSRKRKGMMREYIIIKSNDPRRRSLSLGLSAYIVTKKQLKELFARYKKILD